LRREFISNRLFLASVWNKKLLLFIVIILFLTFNISSSIIAQTTADSLNVIKEKYNNKKFSGTLKMEGISFPEEVSEINILFFLGTQKQDESTDDVTNGDWSYQTDVTTWPLGTYDVTLIALDTNKSVISGGEITFQIEIESEVEAGIKQGEIFTKDFISKFKNKKFTDSLKMSKTLPDDVHSVETKITKGGDVKKEKTSSDLQNSWSFETSVDDWKEGDYNVILTARAQNNTVLDTAVFKITVEEEQPYNMPLFCGVMLVIFIILLIVFFILSMLKNKKIMSQLRFDPKTVSKKLPAMSYISMFAILLLVIAGTGICMTAGLDLGVFLLFLASLGLTMLISYFTFSNRNIPSFVIFIILSIISLIVIILASIWSEPFAAGLIAAALILLVAYIIFFIFLLFYWLTSRRGIFIALVAVILSLLCMILHIVFLVLAFIIIIPWWLTTGLGSLLLLILLYIVWIILREDLFYFELREESKTHRGSRKTYNMFDILSTPRGLFRRDYDRKVMGKISFEQTLDKNVRMEVISLREWDTIAGRNQGRRLMGVYVNKMRTGEGPPFNKEPMAKNVKYTIYSSDVNLDDKLKLCKAFGFEVSDSGRERGLDYFDLELVHRPFLGLGTPMGSPKKKKDYDKESGYSKDEEKESDREREHRYDYERDEERRREEEDRRAKAGYQHDSRDRRRDRAREREPDEDLDDWSARDRRRRDTDRERDRDRYGPERGERPERSEPPPEKPKKRPPPPRIISDA
jgi:hypothetical protein